MELKYYFFKRKIRERVRSVDNNLASQIQQVRQEHPYNDECGEWELNQYMDYMSTSIELPMISF